MSGAGDRGGTAHLVACRRRGMPSKRVGCASCRAWPASPSGSPGPPGGATCCSPPPCSWSAASASSCCCCSAGRPWTRCCGRSTSRAPRRRAAVGGRHGAGLGGPDLRRHGAARAPAGPRRAGHPARRGQRARRGGPGRPGHLRRPRVPQPGPASAGRQPPGPADGLRRLRPDRRRLPRHRRAGRRGRGRAGPAAAAGPRGHPGLAGRVQARRRLLGVLLEDDPARPAAALPRPRPARTQRGQGGPGLRAHRLPAQPLRRALRGADRRAAAGGPTPGRPRPRRQPGHRRGAGRDPAGHGLADPARVGEHRLGQHRRGRHRAGR